jgi:hypothetical protein
MRKVTFLVLLVSAFLSACSSGGSDSPSDTEAHPSSWFVTHPASALATPGFADCTGCHGPNLEGNGRVVSCFSCHSFNTEPPFSFHPPSWDDPYSDHRAFAATNGFGSCTACHGDTLRGRQSAPSCFSSSFEGRSCHAEGPGEVPHPLDGSYLNGALHGPDAEADLTVCQACHGQLGGPGSNPRFNEGILTAGGNGCETCHGVNYAHPPDWAEPPTLHNEAGNMESACTLCHGVDLDGGVGVSCFDCHTADPAANPDGCISCHNTPPDGGPPVGEVSPNLAGQHGRGGHTVFISATPLATCDRCHSGAGAGTAAHFDMDFPADLTLPLDPQDTIVPVPDGSNVTCNGSCHVNGPAGEFDFPHTNAKWY